VRYFFWFVQIFNVSFILLGVTFSVASGQSTLLNQILAGNNGSEMRSNFPAFIANLAWAMVFVSLIVFLPVAIKAKDPVMRKHLKWLALAAAVTGVEFIALGAGVNQLSALSGLLASSIFFVLLGYCLYRSARALVPLNRIPSEKN
jgi:predicted neutral ceramidase superfamily lipid hydrolase